MKRAVFLIFFSMNSFLSQSQDSVNNFKLENNEVIWQKVYAAELSKEEILNRIRNKGIFDNIDAEDVQIRGDIRQIDADFKGAGYSEMLTPIYISRSHINAFSLVEFKDGKYRVTIKKIILEQAYDDHLSKQGEKTSLETYAIKNQHFTSGFKKSPSIILNYTFNKLFATNNEKMTIGNIQF